MIKIIEVLSFRSTVDILKALCCTCLQYILLKVSFNILPPQTFKHIHFKPPTQSDVLCGSMFFFLLAIATCSGQPPQR